MYKSFLINRRNQQKMFSSDVKMTEMRSVALFRFCIKIKFSYV